jgi:signal transduction histidine kinase/DNA-binding response OmpR family regulator
VKLMKWYHITPLNWRRVFAAIFLVALAVMLRVWPLHSLGNKLAWLTFYPIVMISAIYGGFSGGMISTVLACAANRFLWQIYSETPLISTSTDWLGMAVFAMTGIMISLVAESMRRANRRSIAAQIRAQAANEAKSSFLANMSHELRTPLNAILGYSQLMQRDPQLSRENKDYLETINRSGEHLLSLINDVLDIAKIESRKASLNIAVFDMHELITDIRKMFILRADIKKIAMAVDGLEDIPKYLEGDILKFKMVLINLLGNAVKFTENGKIGILLRAQKTAENLWLVSVSISDTGLGIAPDEIGKLFQFFSQTESGRASTSGTGLGLAISQEYVRMMGGEITVSSAVGTGSTFSFTIPMREANPRQANRDSDPSKKTVTGLAPGQRTPVVMVAEDTEDSRRLLVRLLGIVSTDIIEAADGVQAVQLYELRHPDIIWMDIRMPVMDGLEATRRIRASRLGKDVRIVALSAHVFEDEREAILAAGCDDIVTKPFHEYEIFQKMADCLNLQYQYAETSSAEPAAAEAEPPPTITSPAVVQALRGLRDALVVLDTEQIEVSLEKLRTDDAPLADYLEKMADNMDYASLLKSTEGRLNDA